MPRKNIPGPVPEGCQWCHGCASAVPFAGFDKDRRRPAGIAARCRECSRERERERYAIRRTLADLAARLDAKPIGTPLPEAWEPERPVWL